MQGHPQKEPPLFSVLLKVDSHALVIRLNDLEPLGVTRPLLERFEHVHSVRLEVFGLDLESYLDRLGRLFEPLHERSDVLLIGLELCRADHYLHSQISSVIEIVVVRIGSVARCLDRKEGVLSFVAQLDGLAYYVPVSPLISIVLEPKLFLKELVQLV